MNLDGDLTLTGTGFGGIKMDSSSNSPLTLMGNGVKLQGTGAATGIYSGANVTMEGGSITGFAQGLDLEGTGTIFLMKGGTIDGSVKATATACVMVGGCITGTLKSPKAYWGKSGSGSINGTVVATPANTANPNPDSGIKSAGGSDKQIPDGSNGVKAWQ
jgi:hypothetical protein